MLGAVPKWWVEGARASTYKANQNLASERSSLFDGKLAPRAVAARAVATKTLENIAKEVKRRHKMKGKGGGRRPTQGVQWVFDECFIGHRDRLSGSTRTQEPRKMAFGYSLPSGK